MEVERAAAERAAAETAVVKAAGAEGETTHSTPKEGANTARNS